MSIYFVKTVLLPKPQNPNVNNIKLIKGDKSVF